MGKETQVLRHHVSTGFDAQLATRQLASEHVSQHSFGSRTIFLTFPLFYSELMHTIPRFV